MTNAYDFKAWLETKDPNQEYNFFLDALESAAEGLWFDLKDAALSLKQWVPE